MAPAPAGGLHALAAVEAIRVGVSALLWIYLARRLGSASFGSWTFALALAGYPLALVEAGLTWIGARDVAAAPHAIRALVRRIVGLRLMLALPGLGGMALAAFLLGEGAADPAVILLTGLSLLTTSVTLDWVLYGLEQRRIVAVANLAKIVIFAAPAFWLVREPAHVWGVPVLQAIGELAAAGLLWHAFVRATPQEQESRPRAVTVSDLIRQAAPLTLAQLLRAVAIWSTATALGLFSTAAAVGQFGAAQRVTFLAGGFTTLYFFTYVPRAARASQQGVAAVGTLVRSSLLRSVAAATLFSAAASAAAEPLVEHVFGISYLPAAPALRILVWTIPLSVFGGHLRHTLIAARLTSLDLAAVAAGAAVTVILTVLLIPRLGLAGGAAAMVAGEAALAGAALLLVRHSVGSVWRRTGR